MNSPNFPVESNNASSRWIVPLVSIGLIMMVWSLIALPLIDPMYQKAASSRLWTSVNAKIVGTGFEKQLSGTDQKYLDWIHYKYPVADRIYVGVYQLPGTFDAPVYAEKALEQYPKGKDLTVYYNPEKPSETTTEPGKDFHKWEVEINIYRVMCAAGFICLLGAGALALRRPRA